MALKTATVLETLVRLDMMDLGHPGPWPGEPEGFDVLDIDWTGVQRGGDVDRVSESLNSSWFDVADELERRQTGGFALPPEDVLDGLAWYLPMHYFGPAWGIYIRESAVLEVAAAIHQRLSPARRGVLDAVMGSTQAALTVLYLHEAFHHKVESFAIRLEVIERKRRYRPYMDQVVIERGILLEEGLACAEMIRRLGEQTYRRGMPEDVFVAAIEFLHDWIPTLPPGYHDGVDLAERRKYDEGRERLSNWVQEPIASPMRDQSDWALVPHTYRGLFNWKSIAQVLVPIGDRPIVPWFDSPVRSLSVSTRELDRLLRSQGYAEVAGGKGSHRKYKATGRPMVILPDGRRDLSMRVLRTVVEALGFSSVRELASEL